MNNNNIRKYREEKEMTQKELAERSEISVGYLCHLERGSRDNPSKEVMKKIAIVLNKSVQEIFFSD